MAYVAIENDQIVGVFGCPQAEPVPPGYQEIPDDDPRIEQFLTAQKNREHQP